MADTLRTTKLDSSVQATPNSVTEIDIVKKDVSSWVWVTISQTRTTPEISMKELITSKIQNLPPLPKTIGAINQLKNEAIPDNEALLKIILTDPMIVANILKVSNSAIYGYSGKIKTPQDALRFLGFKIISNISINTAIVGYLQPNLQPYGADMESFTSSSSLQSKIIDRWKDPKIRDIKNELQFAAFMQEVGVIIISTIIVEKNLTQNFKEALTEHVDQNLAEEILFGQSGSEVTSMVFSHWKFNQKMIDYIRHADRPENAEEIYKIGSQALKIAKTLAPVWHTRITAESVARATALVNVYGFDSNSFGELIDWISDSV